MDIETFTEHVSLPLITMLRHKLASIDSDEATSLEGTLVDIAMESSVSIASREMNVAEESHSALLQSLGNDITMMTVDGSISVDSTPYSSDREP